MIAKGLQQFKEEARVEEDNIQVLFEITLNNLSAEGDIDEQDFLDRADVLCSIGQTVLISNYQKYFKLVEFFSQHTKKRMGIIMGANTLSMVFDEKYYRNLNGGILEAFGILFSRDLKMYLYPWMDQPTGELWKVDNTPLHPRMQPLFDYLRFNKRIIDIPYDEDVWAFSAKRRSNSSKPVRMVGNRWCPILWTASSRRTASSDTAEPQLQRNPTTKRTQRRQPPEPFHLANNRTSSHCRS